MFGGAGEYHVGPEVVGHFLEGLADNTVVALPSTCVQELGLTPNINDLQRPKELWMGRLRQLRHILRSEVLKAATEPQEVRRTLLQSAAQSVESRQPSEIKMNMKLAELTDDELVSMAHAATVIQKHWRRTQVMVANSMAVLENFQNCIVKGFVIVECGSAGIVGDSLRYMRMLAGMGYMVLAPDDMAKKSPLRHRASKNIIRPEDPTDFWQNNLLYTDQQAAGEMVYQSTTENFINNPDRFDQLYNNIITLRQAGLCFMMRRLPAYIKRHGIFLLGMSEGAIALSSFNDDMFADFIRGRVLCSYSCEPNYWNYNRPEDIGINGRADIPTLNMMGFEDEYFGSHNSIAASIASYAGLPSVQGHAFDTMVTNNIQWGLVAHFEGARHALCLTHQNVIKEILTDFLERPQHTCRNVPSTWAKFKDLQDLITRSRRSNNQQVLYLRILPPSQDNPQMNLSSGINVPQMLGYINKELYKLDYLSDDGELSIDFQECCEMEGLSPKSKSSGLGSVGGGGGASDLTVLFKKARLLAHTISAATATTDIGEIPLQTELKQEAQQTVEDEQLQESFVKEVTFQTDQSIPPLHHTPSGLRNLRLSLSQGSGLDRLNTVLSSGNAKTQLDASQHVDSHPKPANIHQFPSSSLFTSHAQIPQVNLISHGYEQNTNPFLQSNNSQEQIGCAQTQNFDQLLEVIKIQNRSIQWLSGAMVSLSVLSLFGTVASFVFIVVKSQKQ